MTDTSEASSQKRGFSLGALSQRLSQPLGQGAAGPHQDTPAPSQPSQASTGPQGESAGTTARHVPNVSFDLLSGGYRQVRHAMVLNRLVLGAVAVLFLAAVGLGLNWWRSKGPATTQLQSLRSQAAVINSKLTGSSQVSLSQVRGFDKKVATQITDILATQPNVSALLTKILGTQGAGVQITSITIPPVKGATSTSATGASASSASSSSASGSAPAALSISGTASSYPAVAQWETQLQSFTTATTAPLANVKVSYSGSNGQISVTATGTLTKAASISPTPYQTALGATAP